MKPFADPLLPGWKPDDVIWEVAIKEGYGLSSKVEAESKANGKTVYRVTDSDKGQSLRICLADKLTPAMVKKLNLNKDDPFVCRAARFPPRTCRETRNRAAPCGSPR